MFENLSPRELALRAILIGGGLALWVFLSMDPRPSSRSSPSPSSETSSRDVPRDAGVRPRLDAAHSTEVGSSTRTSPPDKASESPSSGDTSRHATHDAERVPDRGESRPASTRARDGGPSSRRDGGESVRRRALHRVVRSAVETIEPDLRRCYETVIETFPDAGEIVVTFEIDPGARRVRIASINDETTLFDTKLDRCTLDHVTELSVDVPWKEHFTDTGTLVMHDAFQFQPSSTSPRSP